MEAKLALTIATISTILLIFLSQNLEPPLTKIESINKDMIGNWVKIRGKIIDKKSLDNLILFTIEDATGTIKAIYRKDRKEIKIKKVMNVTIIGKVIEYKGTLEIEIMKIIQDNDYN